ncbi:hypothetical protein BHE74_00015066, partial [Ensete ventricosum]
FVETDGKGFDRVRRTEIGKKHFKLTHFEEVFTTHHWMVRIYKLKSPKNRIRGKSKKSKSVCGTGDKCLEFSSCYSFLTWSISLLQNSKTGPSNSKKHSNLRKNPW